MAVQSSVPNRTADSSAVVVTPSRAGSDLSAYVAPLTAKEFFFADEGSYSNAYAPLAIAPGGNFGVAQITIAQAAASSFDYEFGFIER